MRYFDDMNKPILSSQNFIYVLHHPSSMRMYIGQTSKGMSRPRTHFLESVLEKTKKEARSKWIKAMRARGHEPLISVLEECVSADDLDEAERFHIANMKALGFKMLNHTDGGGGMRGYQYTEERMQTHVAAMKRRAAEDPKYSERMSDIAKGQWTDEKRKARSERMSGKGDNITPEARAKQAAAVRGVPKSAEARAKMSEAKRLRWQDPTYRARQVAAQKAAKSSPEARAKAAEWAKLASHDTHRSPEYREKMSEIATSALTPELRAKRSENALRSWADDEYRTKATSAMSVGQKHRRDRENKERDSTC